MTKAKTIQQQQLVSKHIPKQKHLTIDLNMIHNPNPAIADAYQKSGAMDQYMDFNDMSENINEKRIFTFSKGNKRNPEGQPIKHKIISLYRVRKDNTEYCFMHNWMKTNDLMGSPHDWTRTLGRYQLPIFSTEYSMTASESDPSQFTDGVAGGTSIERVETIYQYPWEQVKPQLIEWAKQGDHRQGEL